MRAYPLEGTCRLARIAHQRARGLEPKQDPRVGCRAIARCGSSVTFLSFAATARTADSNSTDSEMEDDDDDDQACPVSSDSDRDGNHVHKTADKRESKPRKDLTDEEYAADDDSSDCDQTNPSGSKQRRGDGASQARSKKRKAAKKASKNSASSPTKSAATSLHA